MHAMKAQPTSMCNPQKQADRHDTNVRSLPLPHPVRIVAAASAGEIALAKAIDPPDLPPVSSALAVDIARHHYQVHSLELLGIEQEVLCQL